MPNITPLLKVEVTKEFWEPVFLRMYDEAVIALEPEKEGYTFVHPFDDYDVPAAKEPLVPKFWTSFPMWTRSWCPLAEAASSQASPGSKKQKNLR